MILKSHVNKAQDVVDIYKLIEAANLYVYITSCYNLVNR